MRILAALLLATVAFAGCSGGASGNDDGGDGGNVPPVKVTETTGGIRGVVVDQAIAPLAGAVVRLNTDAETTTDDTGGFTFSELQPGDYFLSVSKPGYEAAQTTTTVEAGVADPDLVRVQLTQIPGADPYFQTYKLDGFYECAFALFFITDGCDFAYRTAWDEYNHTQGSPPPVLPRTIQRFSNTQYIELGADAWAIVQETFWEDANVQVFWQMVSSTPIDNSCDCSDVDFLSNEGPNPLYGRLDRFGEDGTEAGGFPAGQLVAARGFLPFQETTEAGTAVNFEFTTITNVFYNYRPAEGWNFLENGGDDF